MKKIQTSWKKRLRRLNRSDSCPASDDADLPKNVTQSSLSIPKQENSPRAEFASVSDDLPSRAQIAKQYLGAGATFVATLLKKSPDVAENPVKAFLSIAKIGLELVEGMKDNMDAVDRRIASTLSQLVAVDEALANVRDIQNELSHEVNIFTTILGEELHKFLKIKEQARFLAFTLQEDDKKAISNIFERVNQAREKLMLVTELLVHKRVISIDKKLANQLPERLKVSYIADHKHHMEGYQEYLQGRSICTPGTRVRILNEILQWANDTSPASPRIYWLFGPAGSGKSTIAFTIAQHFDLARDADDKTVLGGNFFCSRQFPETRHASRIIRTIVYHLALAYKPFADALEVYGKFESVEQTAPMQLRGLLIEPWSKVVHLPDTPIFLVTIDALDELEKEGGVNFLRHLLDVVNKGLLPGLKFLITSRPHPDLVAHVESFEDKQVCRLEEVLPKEADADIEIYLRASLPKITESATVSKLVAAASGLFIYAATVVQYLKPAARSEHKRLIKALLSHSSTSHGSPEAATSSLDKLYHQILEEAFGAKPRTDPIGFRNRLRVLHTIVCTTERTSPSLVSSLLSACDRDSDAEYDSEDSSDSLDTDLSIAQDVLHGLHAVLHVENGVVLWFHKSFPDFLFDQARSGEFYCDQRSHHELLFKATFGIMKAKLRFNITEISSSFILDGDNPNLQDSIEKNISPVLRYACNNWVDHLSLALSRVLPKVSFLDTISDFLRLHVLFWLEVMNLTGNRRRCHPLLLQVFRLLNHGEVPRILIQDLADAVSFSLYFTGNQASLSTPHLYLSSLATFPRNCKLRETWRRHFPGIPTFTNRGDLSDNSRPLMTLGSKIGKTRLLPVAFSPDSTSIVAATPDGMITFWDSTTGEKIQEMENVSSVKQITFCPDMRHLVTVAGGAIVEAQSVTRRESRSQVNVQVFPLDEAEDGCGVVRVWQVSTGELADEVFIPSDVAAVSPDRKYVVYQRGRRGFRQAIVLGDMETGEVTREVEREQRVREIIFSTDRSRIIFSDNSGAWLWDFQTQHPITQIAPGYATSITPSHDWTVLASCSYGRAVQLWSLSRQQHLSYTFPPSTEAHGKATFSPDGEYIVTWGSFSFQVWSITGNYEHVMQFNGSRSVPLTLMVFSSDGRLAAGMEDGTVQVWDLSTISSSLPSAALEPNSEVESCRQLARPTHPRRSPDRPDGLMYDAILSPDGLRLVSTAGPKTLQAWDVENGGKFSLAVDAEVEITTGLAYSPNGTFLVSGHKDGTVVVWDTTSSRTLSPSRVLQAHNGNAVGSVAVSPDNTRIASKSYSDQVVKLWDVQSGMMVKSWDAHRVPASVWKETHGFVRRGFGRMPIAFSADGRYIVQNLNLAHLQVWDVESQEGEGEEEGNEGEGSPTTSATDLVCRSAVPTGTTSFNSFTYLSATFLPAASDLDALHLAACAAWDVHIWNVATRQLVKTLRGHRDYIQCVESIPGIPTRVVTASKDQTVRIWDVEAGETVRVLEGHLDGITGLGVSAAAGKGGYTILSVGETLRVWTLRPDFSPRYTKEKQMDGTSMDDKGEETAVADGRHTGWLLHPENFERLMYVPAAEALPDDENFLVIPSSATSHVEFGCAKFGSGWAECYSPVLL